jgi:predicted flap endonuclease-1-like 5' DNA nuclease
MSKNKLSSKMLKAFTKSVKKVESIAFNKKYKENGETFSSFDLLFKHKEGEADKLGDLVKQIWNKKEIPSKSDLKALLKALVDLKDGKSDKSKKKKKKWSNKEITSSPKLDKALEKKEVVSKPRAKSKKAASKPTSKKPATKAKSPIKEKAKPIQPKVTSNTTSKSSAKKETKSSVKPEKKTTSLTSTKVKPATKRSQPTNKALKKTAATAAASKPAAAPKRALKSPRVGDNLKLIDGIGPKIESFLKEDGIDTFAKLAKAVPAAIQTMMVAKGGTRYNAYNPAKWPDQAALKAEELKALKSKA